MEQVPLIFRLAQIIQMEQDAQTRDQKEGLDREGNQTQQLRDLPTVLLANETAIQNFNNPQSILSLEHEAMVPLKDPGSLQVSSQSSCAFLWPCVAFTFALALLLALSIFVFIRAKKLLSKEGRSYWTNEEELESGFVEASVIKATLEDSCQSKMEESCLENSHPRELTSGRSLASTAYQVLQNLKRVTRRQIPTAKIATGLRESLAQWRQQDQKATFCEVSLQMSRQEDQPTRASQWRQSYRQMREMQEQGDLKSLT